MENALGSEGTFGLKVTGNSLPQILKNNGYATALVGKWHLGGTVTGDARVGGPRAHGFEYFFGLMGSHIDYWHHNRGPDVPDLWENETRINLDGRYMTNLIAERSIRFIEQSAAAGRPFFVDVAYNAPHWPYQRPDRPSPAPGTGAHQLPQQDNTATRDDLRAMLESVDQGVGEILKEIERLGLTNNTIVIFTNDNGGEWLMNNGPLFNRKWTRLGRRDPRAGVGEVARPDSRGDRLRSGRHRPSIWSASIIAAAGAHGAGEATRASTCSRFSRGGSRRSSGLCTGGRSLATAVSAR